MAPKPCKPFACPEGHEVPSQLVYPERITVQGAREYRHVAWCSTCRDWVTVPQEAMP